MQHEESAEREWPAPLPPEMAEHERQRQEQVRAMMRKVRPDSGFFDWPVKQTKEFRVAVDLCHSMGEAIGLASIGIGPDPPDVLRERKPATGGIAQARLTRMNS